MKKENRPPLEFKAQLAIKAKSAKGVPTYRRKAAPKQVLSGEYFNPKKYDCWMFPKFKDMKITDENERDSE